MGTIRRIQNELLKEWTEEYQNNNSIYKTDTNLYSGEKEVTFHIFFNGNYNPLFVTIDFKDRYYPFKPPIVYIGNNKVDYISLLPTSWEFSNKLLGNKCACCNSILCHWPGPSTTIKSIMEEVKKNFILKIRMMEIAHCRKIIEKKLGIDYVPIEEFI